jgi:hypothetical protein
MSREVLIHVAVGVGEERSGSAPGIRSHRALTFPDLTRDAAIITSPEPDLEEVGRAFDGVKASPVLVERRTIALGRIELDRASDVGVDSSVAVLEDLSTKSNTSVRRTDLVRK